jgi:hypothetical protein
MKAFITIWITAVMLALELTAGNWGLPLGLPLFTAVYFYVAFGRFYGLSATAAAGLLLDVIYAREYLFSPLVYLLITFWAAESVKRMHHRKMPAGPLISGGLCGLLINLNNNLTAWISGNELPGPDMISMWIFQLAGGSMLMLLIVPLFDAVNFRSHLPRFCEPKSSRLENML